MTRLLLSASLCLLIATSMDAQQDPQFTQWFMEPASFNPAVAGNSELTCISGTYRNQWVGLDGDPNTSMLTAHTFVDQLQGGVLLSFYNDALGQEENTMARLGYAYHMEPLSNGAIVSAGLSASMFTKKLGNEWISIDPWQDDNAIPNDRIKLECDRHRPGCLHTQAWLLLRRNFSDSSPRARIVIFWNSTPSSYLRNGRLHAFAGR